MKINVFISSNIDEFFEERKYIADEINKDPSLNEYFNIYVFEQGNADSSPSGKVFRKNVEDSDIYIGLIGSNYGNIYRNNLSATEFEYELFSSKKSDSYFFVKECEVRDEGSIKFLNRIKPNKTYKLFSNKEQLLIGVKNCLKDCMINNSKTNIFDSTLIPDSTFDDVDQDALMLFYDVLEDTNIKNLIGIRSDDKILECVGAGKIDDKGVFHLNNAGALFFAKNMNKFNLDYEIKMVRFNGLDRRVIIDKHTSTSPFFILLNEFEHFFNRNTKKSSVIKGMKSYSIPEYPIEAVREAFVNALAHRDYSFADDCITFYIYDDRILISSPGSLPFPLTVEDLMIEVNPKHRNKIICKIFEKTKYMEHVGTGITRMTNEMIDSGLPRPEFYNGNYFKVILRGPNGKLIYTEKHFQEDGVDLSNYDLNDRQCEALKLMMNNSMVFTYQSYSDYFNVSLTTSKRDLQELIDYNLIIKQNNSKIKKFISI